MHDRSFRKRRVVQEGVASVHDASGDPKTSRDSSNYGASHKRISTVFSTQSDAVGRSVCVENDHRGSHGWYVDSLRLLSRSISGSFPPSSRLPRRSYVNVRTRAQHFTHTLGIMGMGFGVIMSSFEGMSPPVVLPGQPEPPKKTWKQELRDGARKTKAKSKSWGKNFAALTGTPVRSLYSMRPYCILRMALTSFSSTSPRPQQCFNLSSAPSRRPAESTTSTIPCRPDVSPEPH